MSAGLPTVSVCIPVYNGAAFLAAAIESVLAQTFADLELVITDDASTDDSLAVARRYADPRVRVLPAAKNEGAAANWNRAVAECRGTLVKLLCQDDLIEPNCLAEQLAVFDADKSKQIALVCGARNVIDARGHVLFHGKPRLPAGRVSAARALRAVVRSGTNPIGEPAAVMFRREAYDRAGGFNGERLYMVDLDLWCRLLRFGDMHVVPSTVASFRVSGQSLSASIGRKQAAQARAFFGALGRDRCDVVTKTDVALGCLKATGLGLLRGAVFNAARWRAARGRT